MTDYVKAAADARQLLRGFRAFADLAEAFDSVGQAIATKAEAEKVTEDLKKDIAKAQAELVAAKDAAKKELAEAKAKADASGRTAEKRAADMIAGADRLAADTKARAEALLAEANARVAVARREADEALAARDAAQRELAEIEGRIVKAKAQIQKLLG